MTMNIKIINGMFHLPVLVVKIKTTFYLEKGSVK